MKKLKVFECCIGLFFVWIVVFDNVCDQCVDDGLMFQSLVVICKIVQGIMVELENSCYYIYQKFEKFSWE